MEEGRSGTRDRTEALRTTHSNVDELIAGS